MPLDLVEKIGERLTLEIAVIGLVARTSVTGGPLQPEVEEGYPPKLDSAPQNSEPSEKSVGSHRCLSGDILAHIATFPQRTAEGSIWPSGHTGPWICVNQYISSTRS